MKPTPPSARTRLRLISSRIVLFVVFFLLIMAGLFTFARDSALASMFINALTSRAPSDTLESGLVGHWTFDGPETNWQTNTTNDTSGQNNDGTMTNMSATSSAVQGVLGQGLRFDGVDDYVLGPLVGPQTMTVSLWVKPVDTARTNYPIAANLDPGDKLWSIRIDNGSYNPATISLLYVDSLGTYYTVTSVTAPIIANEWQHIVAVYNVTNSGTGSGTFTLYVNGANVTLDSNTFTDWFGSGNTPLTIADDRDGNFEGTIDDVRIYNRALSAAEVKALYGRGGSKLTVNARPSATTLTEGLVGYWPMDPSDTLATVGPTTISTGVANPGANSAITSGRGDNNGFEGTQAGGSLTAVDGAGLADLSSGTGNATDGCGTFPQGEDDLHTFSNFNISVPAGSTINGITVTLAASSTLSGTNLLCTALSWDGGISTSTVKSTGDVSDTVTTYTLGGPADTWGHTWSVSELANANFRLSIMPDTNNSNARNFFLDQLSVNVTYSTTTYHAATSTDRSGNGNDGTIEGAATSTGRIGGGGLDFSGVSDRISVTDPGTNNALDFATGETITVSAWIKPDTLATDGIILTKGAVLGAFNANYQYYVAANGAVNFGFSENGSGTWNDIFSDPGAVSVGSWQFVVAELTFGGNNSGKIYVNGQPVSININANPYTAVPWVTNDPLWIAAENVSGPIDMLSDGQIDDVRIYKRALSPQEVADLYALESPSHPDTTLVSHWTFDGPDILSTTAIDRGFGGNSLTMGSGIGAVIPVLGKSGQAIKILGVPWEFGETLLPAGNLELGLGDKTITGWVNYDQQADLGAHAALFAFSGSPGYYVYFNPTLDMLGTFVDTGSGSTYYSVSSPPLFGTGWHMTSYVIDRDAGVTFYMDGASLGTDGTSVYNGTNIVSGNTAYIGGYDANVYKGSYDDVRIYNRALTPAEISALYTTSAPKMTVNASMNAKQTSGLVGLWSFDGPDVNWAQNKALDRSGNNNHGTFVNMSTTTSPTAGKIGQGMKFDFSDDEVTTTLPLSSLISAASASLSVWVKPGIQFDSSGVPSYLGCVVCDSAGNIGIYRGSYAGFGHDAVLVQNYDGNDDAVEAKRIYAGTYEWIHVVLVHSGGTLSAYADGVFVGSISSGDTSGLAGTWHIGGDYAVSTPLDGTIDDVRIYNKALTLPEIQILYKMGR